MKREIALRIVALLWLLVPSSSILGDELSGRSPATATPPPIVTRQRLFSIPFYLNPQARPPQEVLLYVSGDQGRAWSLYQRRRAIDGKFDFQAGGDGEFWFCVRTDQDSLPPTDKAQPEKVVVVDTAEPEMSMNIQVSPSGFLKGRWRVLDPNLDASTFQLQYQLAGEDRWRPVTVDLPAPGRCQPIRRRGILDRGATAGHDRRARGGAGSCGQFGNMGGPHRIGTPGTAAQSRRAGASTRRGAAGPEPGPRPESESESGRSRRRPSRSGSALGSPGDGGRPAPES